MSNKPETVRDARIYDSVADFPPAAEYGVGPIRDRLGGVYWSDAKKIIDNGSIVVLDGVIFDRHIHRHLIAAIQFFKAPFRARQYAIINGSTPFFPKINLETAVRVNGATQTELQAALDFASATPASQQQRHKIVLVTSTITISTDISIPSDVILVCRDAGKIAGATGAEFITLNPRSVAACLDIDSIGFRCATTTWGCSKAAVIGCRATGILTSTTQAFINDLRTTDNTLHESVTAVLNESDGPKSFIWGQFLSSWNVMLNKFTGINSESGGRFLRTTGGTNNRFKYNLIDGGIAGLVALLDKSQSIGFYNNDISDNYLQNIYEEGVSLDSYANFGDNMSLIERLVITGTSGTWSSSPKLKFPRTSLTAMVYSSYTTAISAVVLTGILAGRYLDIIAINTVSAGVTYDIQIRNRAITAAELTALVGAVVAIVIRCDSNTIQNNVFKNVFHPVSLWGTGYHNLIDNNSVYRDADVPGHLRDISITGIGGLSPESTQYPTLGYISPANNIVTNNSAHVAFLGKVYGDDPGAALTDSITSMPNIAGNNTVTESLPWERAPSQTVISPAVPGATVTTLSSEGLTNTFSDIDASLLPERQSGTYTANGTGAQTVFNIPHLLSGSYFTGWKPSKFGVEAGSAVAAAPFFVTADTTNLIVTFNTAPASGTNNVVLNWWAES